MHGAIAYVFGAVYDTYFMQRTTYPFTHRTILIRPFFAHVPPTLGDCIVRWIFQHQSSSCLLDKHAALFSWPTSFGSQKCFIDSRATVSHVRSGDSKTRTFLVIELAGKILVDMYFQGISNNLIILKKFLGCVFRMMPGEIPNFPRRNRWQKLNIHHVRKFNSLRNRLRWLLGHL